MRDGTGERVWHGKAPRKPLNGVHGRVICSNLLLEAHECCVCGQAAAKLQAVLQENPRWLRPTLRKKNKKTPEVKAEQTRVKTEPAEHHVHGRIPSNVEVWEIETDSDVELLPAAPMAASGSIQPKVAWTCVFCSCDCRVKCWEPQVGTHFFDRSEEWWAILRDGLAANFVESFTMASSAAGFFYEWLN